MKIVVLFLTLMFSFSLVSKTSIPASTSLEWQRLDLEEKIRNKINDAFLFEFKENRPTVNVYLTLIDQSKIEKKEKNKKEEIPKDEKEGIPEIKNNDLLSPLVKFGIDFSLDLKEKDEEVSNRPVDLFDSILKVYVDIRPLKKFEKKEETYIKKSVSLIVKRVTGKKASIKVYLPLEKKKIVPVKKVIVKKNKYFEFFKEFNLFIAIILATLIFILLGRLIFSGVNKQIKRISSIFEENGAAAGAGAGGDGSGYSEGTNVNESINSTEATIGDINQNMNNIDEFKDLQIFEKGCLDDSKMNIALIKKWIAKNGKQDENLLRTILFIFAPNSLIKLLTLLNESEKKYLRNISGFAGEMSLPEANNYLKKEITSEVMSSGDSINKDLQTKVYNLTLNDVINTIEADYYLGGYLLRYLETSMIARAFEKLSEESLNKFKIHMLNNEYVQSEEDDSKLFKAIEVIEQSNKTAVVPSIIQKLIEQIDTLSVKKEKYLLSTIIELNNYKLLESVTYKHYPAELVFELDDNFVKTLLMSWNGNKRMCLLFNCDEEKRAKFLGAIGDENSKARKLLTIELNEIEQDEERKEEMLSQKENIFGDYAKFARKMFVSDNRMWKRANQMRKEWLEKVIEVPKDEKNNELDKAS